MWKIVVAFVVFAAIALFVLFKSGGNIDMGGEKHSGDMHAAEPAPAASASGAASAPMAAPASAPASAASAAQ